MTGQIFSQSTGATFYPTNHVIAILDELEDAQQAIEALRLAGFEGRDILLITPPQSVETINSREQRWHLLDRIRQMVENVVSDEGPYQEMCEQVLKQGHHMVNVRALHDKEQQLAATILKDHRGHSIKFFGRWTITSPL
jgi:hypothetical protein